METVKTDETVAKPKKTEIAEKEKPVLEIIESGDDFIQIAPGRESATVELVIPLGEKEEIVQVTMRRPLIKDGIEAEIEAEGSAIDEFIIRLAALCGIELETFKHLDTAEDFITLTDAYALLKTHPEYKKAELNKNIKMAKNRRSVAIRLIHPITYHNGKGEKTYDTLTMIRPSLGTESAAEKSSEYSSEQKAYEYAALCSVPVEVIKRLDDIDDGTSVVQAHGMFRRSKISRRKKR